MYLTSDWDTAEAYGHGDLNKIKAVKLKEDAEIIDFSKAEDREKAAKIMFEDFEDMEDEEQEKILNDFKNMDFVATGLSDDPEIGDKFYEANIDAVIDNSNRKSVDIMSPWALETYIPEEKT